MKRLSGCQIGCLIMILIFGIMYLVFDYYEGHEVAGLFYFLIEPKDIKEPIMIDEFDLRKEGYEKTYEIHPKYRGYYRIFIRFENFDINDKDLIRCPGEIEIWYSNDDKNIGKKVVTSFVGYQSSRYYDRWYDSITLDMFLYYNNIFRRDINKIRIKVNKPLRCLPKGKDKKTYVVIRYTFNL